MEETIAELRRQLEEEKRAREEAERRLQPNALFRLLDRCHNSLSQAIQVETDATLTKQGDATNPVNRLYPKRIIPWLEFPQLQEKVWEKIGRMGDFASWPLFPSDEQLDYVAANNKDRPIYSEMSLRNFERETVDNFVEKVIDALRNDQTLRDEFGIQGRVTFYDRAETSLENSMEHMTLRSARSPQRRTNTRLRPRTPRKRNRRADQFCVHTVANEQRRPVYAVEFKAPHKVTISELVAGLHEIDLARDVIDQEGDTFEYHATRLIAAVVTQIFSYMIDSGVQDGYICTGEAFYYLCVPNQDVQENDQCRLHRTAIGQVVAFTLRTLAAEAPPQQWLDTAHEELTTWKVEYLDILRDIPGTIRGEGPATSVYRPSYWKLEPKTHDTGSHARCQPETPTSTNLSTEESSSDEENHSPSTAAAARSRSIRVRANKHRSLGQRSNAEAESKSREDNQTTRTYCTMACVRGIVYQSPLDKECPNFQSHRQYPSSQRHSIGPADFTRRLHRQLAQNRNLGFEQLHVRGRTGFLMKATLLTHGYTVIIKATTTEKQSRLQAEVDNYGRLKSLQGQYIPVCVGTFNPRVAYWYHGQLMAQMMILSWSGMRVQHIIDNRNFSFFDRKREEALTVLRSHGISHGDGEWRNMLWDEIGRHFVVIDLEDMKWLKSPPTLGSVSGNVCHRVRDVKSKQCLPSGSTGVCT